MSNHDMHKINQTKPNSTDDLRRTPIDPGLDPIVEILRLAYRRGLAIRREREKQAEAIEQKDSDNEEKQDVPEDLSEAK